MENDLKNVIKNSTYSNNFLEEKVKLRERCQNYEIVLDQHQDQKWEKS